MKIRSLKDVHKPPIVSMKIDYPQSNTTKKRNKCIRVGVGVDVFNVSVCILSESNLACLS